MFVTPLDRSGASSTRLVESPHPGLDVTDWTRSNVESILHTLHCLVAQWLGVGFGTERSRVRLPVATFPSNKVNSISLPSLRGRQIEYRPAWLGLRRGALNCVGWQVTLCDPIRQVTLRSSVIDLSIKSYTYFTFYLFYSLLSLKRDVFASSELRTIRIKASMHWRSAEFVRPHHQVMAAYANLAMTKAW